MSTLDGSLYFWVCVLGLTITVLFTRGFFLVVFPRWRMPDSVQTVLAYAPALALLALVAPDVLLYKGNATEGAQHLWLSYQNPRLMGALAYVASLFWKKSLIFNLVIGLSVFTLVRLYA